MRTSCLGWASYFSTWFFSSEAMGGHSSPAALLETLPSPQDCEERFQMEMSWQKGLCGFSSMFNLIMKINVS